MSDTKHTDDEGPPLDPHTLQVVIERIGDLRGKYAAAGFQDHEWALANASAILSGLLATTSDRARVVVLPEPFQTGSFVTDWPCGVWSDGTVVYVTGGYVTTQTGRTMAGSILASVEFASGAQ